MIRINQIKLPIDHTKEQLEKKIKKTLYKTEIKNWYIWKQSIDARNKDNLCFVYAVNVEIDLESEVDFINRNKNRNIQQVKMKKYEFPNVTKEFKKPPVIVGLGPAGLFCALMLAKAGLNPIVIERGRKVEQRVNDVNEFWTTGKLNIESNVQFGEGGAGAFSDGKLNTLVKDKFGRNRFVLETLVYYGAPEEILYEAKPHIGTDLLCQVVGNIRDEIIKLGGKIHYQTKLTDVMIENNSLKEIEVNNKEKIACTHLILALGHSARDTFERLYERKIHMEQKAFAIGVRVEHPRQMINESQYGKSKEAKKLPSASYKLTYHARNGRSVYSFCMCPGGFVVNASSEEGKLTVNGMSNHDRNEKNSNSAIIASVTPDDFDGKDPMAGVRFQQKWEEKAYMIGHGSIPVQLLKDFKDGKTSKEYGEIVPNTKGSTTFGNIRECLPEEVSQSIVEGMDDFERKIKGFSRPDTILCGIEARTSSPVRMVRGDDFQSNITGVYPCGEGAGYAGGITSAAMDGIKVAQALVTV